MEHVQTILRRADVERACGLARSTIYQMMADGRFPRPVRLGPQRVGWLERDIIAWQGARIAERDSAREVA